MLAMNDDFIRMETRVRILNEQIHELKTDGPTPPLAARVYRSLLEADPPMLQEAEETRRSSTQKPMLATRLPLRFSTSSLTTRSGPTRKARETNQPSSARRCPRATTGPGGRLSGF
jgi:hypothetical protein